MNILLCQIVCPAGLFPELTAFFVYQVSIDGDQTEQLIKLLDAIVIMLEGGTEFDLQVLDKFEEDKKSAMDEGAQDETEKVKDGQEEVKLIFSRLEHHFYHSK